MPSAFGGPGGVGKYEMMRDGWWEEEEEVGEGQVVAKPDRL